MSCRASRRGTAVHNACVQEWATAVIGLLGAGVGAGAAMWGAQRAARVSQEALAVQIRKEDERWMRDQRQAAYHAMIRGDRLQTMAARELQTKRDGPSNVLPPELETVWEKAEEETFAALSLIELCGPQPVLDAARELYEAGRDLIIEWSWPRRPRDEDVSRIRAAHQRQQAALEAFRVAAREALGYDRSGGWISTR